jgi:small subunit ribosomal protein S9
MALKLAKKKTIIKKIVKKIKVESLPSQTVASQAKVNSNLTYASGKYFQGVGRRKNATSRVRIYESGGDFIVNDMIVGDYFKNISHASSKYMQPFELTKTKGKFGVTVKVTGSGTSSQLGAMIMGISLALIDFDPANRQFLKPEGLLSRDDRMKETRKVGMGGKARRKRQSPKR